MTNAEIKKMLDEWDASGAVKTSLYWRLQSVLAQPPAPTPKKERRNAEKETLRARRA